MSWCFLQMNSRRFPCRAPVVQRTFFIDSFLSRMKDTSDFRKSSEGRQLSSGLSQSDPLFLFERKSELSLYDGLKLGESHRVCGRSNCGGGLGLRGLSPQTKNPGLGIEGEKLIENPLNIVLGAKEFGTAHVSCLRISND